MTPNPIILISNCISKGNVCSVLGGSEFEYVVGFYRCTYIAFGNTVRYQDYRVWSQ